MGDVGTLFYIYFIQYSSCFNLKIFQVKSETLEIKNNLVKDTGHSTNPSLDIKTPDGLGPTSLVANTNEPPQENTSSSSSGSGDPAYEKYFKMLNLGLPKDV